MKFFFSCDWGTSSFRLRFVDAENERVVSEIKTSQGIALTFESWKQSGHNEDERIAFYQSYILEHVNKIVSSLKESVGKVPVIISGMASSSIGMLELPYKKLPFRCDGSDLIVRTVPGEEDQQNKMIIISGARSANDAMRGEETILIGCRPSMDDAARLFIFPGTHSKHILVKNNVVQNITTYMTGELFDLLSNKSILSASVKKNGSQQSTIHQHFADGVTEGSTSNILNSIFHVRTNHLFKKVTAEENYHYLSGLMIGHELKAVAGSKPNPITLVCSEGLQIAYKEALGILGLSDGLQYQNADAALIRGQRKIMDQAGY